MLEWQIGIQDLLKDEGKCDINLFLSQIEEKEKHAHRFRDVIQVEEIEKREKQRAPKKARDNTE